MVAPRDPEGCSFRPRRVRLAVVLVPLAIVAAACDDSTGSGSSTTAVIEHATGLSDVVVQFGDYQLGAVPDMFVYGPELVIYGDGHVYAEMDDGIKNGAVQFRAARGTMDESAIQDLLHQADELPSTTPVGTAVTDGLPLLLVAGSHRWEINDVSVEPFASYLGRLRAGVDAAADQVWTPSRWIVRPFGASECTVTDQPSAEAGYDAPVYPHLIAQYPIGDFAC